MIRHSEQPCSVLRFLRRLWDPWRRSREADDSWGDCTVYCRQERRLWIMFNSSLLRWVSASHTHPVLFSYAVNDSGVCLLQKLPRPPTGSTHEAEQPLLPSVLQSITTSLASVSCVWLYLNENVRWELGDKKKNQVNKQGRIGFFFSQRQPVVPNA